MLDRPKANGFFLFFGRLVHFWVVVDLPLWKILVNGKDDIPYIMENKSHVPNHQPDFNIFLHSFRIGRFTSHRLSASIYIISYQIISYYIISYHHYSVQPLPSHIRSMSSRLRLVPGVDHKGQEARPPEAWLWWIHQWYQMVPSRSPIASGND